MEMIKSNYDSTKYEVIVGHLPFSQVFNSVPLQAFSSINKCTQNKSVWVRIHLELKRSGGGIWRG